MADSLIHRCTLRVVRRGGWSWGPDPKRFIEEVIRAFPALLARKLSELLPEGEDREFAAPVRIRLAVRISDFLDERSTECWVRPSGDAPSMASLDDRVESALRGAFGLNRESPPGAERVERFSRPALKTEEGPQRNVGKGGALHRLLLAWRKQGVLERRLAALSTGEVETWHGALRRDAASPAEAVMERGPGLERQIETVVRARAPSIVDGDAAEIMRLRIIIAAEIAAQLPVGVSDSVMWQVLNRILPVGDTLSSPATAAKGASDGGPVVEKGEGRAHVPIASSQPAASQEERPLVEPDTISSNWETQVACALPFLVLGPLVRCLLYTSPSPRDLSTSRMPSSA